MVLGARTFLGCHTASRLQPLPTRRPRILVWRGDGAVERECLVHSHALPVLLLHPAHSHHLLLRQNQPQDQRGAPFSVYKVVWNVSDKIRFMSTQVAKSSVSATTAKLEKEVLRQTYAMVGGFIVAWTPYAIFGMIAISTEVFPFSQKVFLSTSLIAKSSILYNAFIYIFMNTSVRARCLFNDVNSFKHSYMTYVLFFLSSSVKPSTTSSRSFPGKRKSRLWRQATCRREPTLQSDTQDLKTFPLCEYTSFPVCNLFFYEYTCTHVPIIIVMIVSIYIYHYIVNCI